MFVDGEGSGIGLLKFTLGEAAMSSIGGKLRQARKAD
jgi:hypothetical protein